MLVTDRLTMFDEWLDRYKNDNNGNSDYGMCVDKDCTDKVRHRF